MGAFYANSLSQLFLPSKKRKGEGRGGGFVCYNPPVMSKEQTQHDREIRQLQAEAARLNAEAAKLNAETAKLRRENEDRWREHRRENEDRWREHDKRMKEHDERMAQLGKSNAELRQSIEGLGQFLAQLDIRIAQIAERADEALKVAEKNNQYISGHANGEGEILEIECYDALWKMRKLNGAKLEGLRLGVNDPHYGVEIDLVGVNGKFTFPMEVKRTLLPEDVRRFKEVQVERFKQAYPELALNKQVTPVVIFALRKKVKNPADGKKEDPVQLALNAGMIVLQSTGKNQLSPITAASAVVKRPHETTDLT